VLTFGNLLDLVGINRASVRLLRHQDNRYTDFHSPYTLWRDHRDRFEDYQSMQSFGDEAKLRAPYWASFVGVPGRGTIFVGMYSSSLIGPLPEERPHPITGAIEPAGVCNLYRTELLSELQVYSGRLWIEWGDGYRTWIQRGDSKPKPVIELRRDLGEPPFPGFQALVIRLSEVGSIPSTWAAALSSTRGIYLLTCPQTKEQYVGMASGVEGFLGRWREYFATGHGGNMGLKSRDPSDYQVSILETVGTGATIADLSAAEVRWKIKLQSREMGLNRN
jgi:hypothetical protein